MTQSGLAAVFTDKPIGHVAEVCIMVGYSTGSLATSLLGITPELEAGRTKTCGKKCRDIIA